MGSGIRTVVILALVVVGVLAAAAPAHAIVFPLTSDHCTGTCGTPPFGQVELTQAGPNVNVTVTLSPNVFFVKTGAGDEQWFWFSGTGVALGDISVTQNFPTHTLVANAGPFSQGAVGSFGFGITCDDCGNGGGLTNRGPGPLIFSVANATIAELTVPNALGNVFVADILGANGNTGLVDATTPTTVPEPGTLALVGSGLVSVGVALRRRWSRRG